MRFFQEISPLQEHWISLETRLAGIESVREKFDWRSFERDAARVLQEHNTLLQHFAEDAKKLDARNDAALKQAFIYVDSLSRCINKLVSIIGRLAKMSRDPNSWTAREYLSDLEAYDKLKEEYKTEGALLNALLAEQK
ncbi:hypothetical protein ACFL2T_02360 [Elusimicrobiota bacterium]